MYGVGIFNLITAKYFFRGKIPGYSTRKFGYKWKQVKNEPIMGYNDPYTSLWPTLLPFLNAVKCAGIYVVPKIVTN